MFQFFLHLYHTLHRLVAGIANSAQLCIFEVHTIESIAQHTISDIQFANQHLRLLAGNVCCGAMRLNALLSNHRK